MILPILPADIVMYPMDPKEWSSRVVAAGECLVGLGSSNRQYTHAGVVAERPGYAWEAVFPFSGCHPIDTSRAYEIWRPASITDVQRTNILHWCEHHDGDLYNLVGVLTAGRVRLPGTYFCSEYACFAYDSVGLHPGDLIKDPDSIPQYPGMERTFVYDPATS